MDACFGLVRKKSSGKASFAPRHPFTVFFDQEKVDNFVDSYTSNAEQAKTVRHYKNYSCYKLHQGLTTQKIELVGNRAGKSGEARKIANAILAAVENCELILYRQKIVGLRDKICQ